MWIQFKVITENLLYEWDLTMLVEVIPSVESSMFYNR